MSDYVLFQCFHRVCRLWPSGHFIVKCKILKQKVKQKSRKWAGKETKFFGELLLTVHQITWLLPRKSSKQYHQPIDFLMSLLKRVYSFCNLPMLFPFLIEPFIKIMYHLIEHLLKMIKYQQSAEECFIVSCKFDSSFTVFNIKKVKQKIKSVLVKPCLGGQFGINCLSAFLKTLELPE